MMTKLLHQACDMRIAALERNARESLDEIKRRGKQLQGLREELHQYDKIKIPALQLEIASLKRQNKELLDRVKTMREAHHALRDVMEDWVKGLK